MREILKLAALRQIPAARGGDHKSQKFKNGGISLSDGDKPSEQLDCLTIKQKAPGDLSLKPPRTGAALITVVHVRA